MTATDVRRRLAGIAAVTVTVDLAVKAAALRWLTVPVELADHQRLRTPDSLGHPS